MSCPRLVVTRACRPGPSGPQRGPAPGKHQAWARGPGRELQCDHALRLQTSRPPPVDPVIDDAPRIAVRIATPGDGAACAAIYGPYVLETPVSFELRPPDADEMTARIERVLERTPWLVAETGGSIVGYAYATRHRERPAYDWTAETAVYVDRDARGQGVGSAAMTALLAVLRLQGFHLAVAGITPPNPASVALHRNLGFERIGEFEAIGWKMGAWQGVEWFGLELGPREAAPAPVRFLSELRGAAGLDDALRSATSRRSSG
jgi:L-amino acid N-acyltransferase YncA